MEGKKGKNKLTGETIEIIIIYFILFCGGLWHILGFFGNLMNVLGGFLMIAVSIYMVIKLLSYNFKESKVYFLKDNTKLTPLNPIIFSVLIIVITWLIEYIGVKTGKIFGHYEYGPALLPQYNGVPLPIGFAWLSTFLSSLAIVKNKLKIINLTIIIFVVAVFMSTFDVFLEPAASKLYYWNWDKIFPPLQNYIAWFVISILVGYAGRFFKVLHLRIPRSFQHIYLAQIIYFFMVYFS